MISPLAYAVLYFAAITIYFTYASEAASSGGLDASAAPLLFALIGLGGLVALRTGKMTGAIGAPVVGVGSVCVVSGALVLLGLGRTSLTLVLVSALVVGAVTSVAAPAAMGALIPLVGLATMLVLVAALAAVGAVSLAVTLAATSG